MKLTNQTKTMPNNNEEDQTHRNCLDKHTDYEATQETEDDDEDENETYQEAMDEDTRSETLPANQLEGLRRSCRTTKRPDYYGCNAMTNGTIDELLSQFSVEY